MKAYIAAIEYHLPAGCLTNEQFSVEFPEWSVEKIREKTGISVRHVAAKNECASDLGIAAANKLFSRGYCGPEDIDYLILCTETPDYFLPPTSCVMQERLSLSNAVGAIDINQGCSGYIYGLGLAKGLIETGQAERGLLITAETYSKFIYPGDKSVRTLFGDAATATLIQGNYVDEQIGPFVYGTDGRGAGNLIVKTGGMRNPRNAQSAVVSEDESGNLRSQDNLYMNGSEIFTFTLNAVPSLVNDLLKRAGRSMDEIDLFVFHQANKFMLDHLRRKIGIPKDKFFISFENYGNTVSSTIPIALKDALDSGRLKANDLVMIVGFGVGYSWGATLGLAEQ